MGTMVGTEPTLPLLLRSITQLEYDTIEAYASAIVRLEERVDRAKLEEFRHDHLRHVQNLVPPIWALGETPPRAGDWRQIVTQGKVLVAGLLGAESVLRAMERNEADIFEAYDRVVRRNDIPANLRPVFEQHLYEARRDHAWLEERVAVFSS